MAYDVGLAERLNDAVAHVPGMTFTGMFGGYGYLLNGNMCMGIHKDTLIVRVGTDFAQKILQEPHVRPTDFTGKVMSGWATIEPEALESDTALYRYCQLAISFVSTLPKKA